MKINCKCGAVFSDVKIPNPNVGELVWDDDTTDDAVRSESIASFLDSIRLGKRDEWLARFYGQDALEVSDADVVIDIYRRHTSFQVVYRCPNCNRLYLRNERNEWLSHVPEEVSK